MRIDRSRKIGSTDVAHDAHVRERSGRSCEIRQARISRESERDPSSSSKSNIPLLQRLVL